MHGRRLFQIDHVSFSVDKMASFIMILQVTGLRSQTKKSLTQHRAGPSGRTF